jgi:hypothetical protein
MDILKRLRMLKWKTRGVNLSIPCQGMHERFTPLTCLKHRKASENSWYSQAVFAMGAYIILTEEIVKRKCFFLNNFLRSDTVYASDEPVFLKHSC